MDFIDSLHGIDELRNRWRSQEVRDSLSLHDVLDRVRVLDEGDDAHLCFARGALKGIHLIDSLDARGPTALTELAPVVTLGFFHWRVSGLSALASSPAGIPSVVSGDGFVGLRNMT